MSGEVILVDFEGTEKNPSMTPYKRVKSAMEAFLKYLHGFDSMPISMIADKGLRAWQEFLEKAQTYLLHRFWVNFQGQPLPTDADLLAAERNLVIILSECTWSEARSRPCSAFPAPPPPPPPPAMPPCETVQITMDNNITWTEPTRTSPPPMTRIVLANNASTQLLPLVPVTEPAQKKPSTTPMVVDECVIPQAAPQVSTTPAVNSRIDHEVEPTSVAAVPTPPTAMCETITGELTAEQEFEVPQAVIDHLKWEQREHRLSHGKHGAPLWMRKQHWQQCSPQCCTCGITIKTHHYPTEEEQAINDAALLMRCLLATLPFLDQLKPDPISGKVTASAKRDGHKMVQNYSKPFVRFVTSRCKAGERPPPHSSLCQYLEGLYLFFFNRLSNDKKRKFLEPPPDGSFMLNEFRWQRPPITDDQLDTAVTEAVMQFAIARAMSWKMPDGSAVPPKQ